MQSRGTIFTDTSILHILYSIQNPTHQSTQLAMPVLCSSHCNDHVSTNLESFFPLYCHNATRYGICIG